MLQRRWGEQPLVFVATPKTLAGGRRVAIVTPLRPSALGPLRPRDPFFTRDPITGLPTRRHLEAHLRRLMNRQREAGHPARVLLSIVEVRNLDRLVRADGPQAADASMIRIAERLRGADRFVAWLGWVTSRCCGTPTTTRPPANSAS